MKQPEKIQILALAYIENKDERLFGKIFERITPNLKRKINFYLSNVDKAIKDDVAEDILMNTYCNILNKIDTYNETKASFSTWVYRIARNEAFIYHKNVKRELHKIFKYRSLFYYNGTKKQSNFDPDTLSYTTTLNDETLIDVKGVTNQYEFETLQLENDKEIFRLKVIEYLYYLKHIFKNMLIDRELNHLTYEMLQEKYDAPLHRIQNRLHHGRKKIKQK